MMHGFYRDIVLTHLSANVGKAVVGNAPTLKYTRQCDGMPLRSTGAGRGGFITEVGFMLPHRVNG
jgi:hypothetical protein